MDNKRELPILFSAPMVQALINGMKTQTRRVMKPQPVKNGSFYEWAGAGWSNDGPLTPVPGHSLSERCPYGKPGDILWVRETLMQEGELGIKYKADNCWINEDLIPDDYGPYGGEYSFRTIPNIYMPKWAARIWLKVWEVRIERLQDITEENAKAEGVEPYHLADMNSVGESREGPSIAYWAAFADLWQAINGLNSWEANPWVWVVKFKVLSTTGKPAELGMGV
jgi:hypothetical protein